MKRIVAALQMLIFGAVGLQIRPSRENPTEQKIPVQ